MSANFVYVIRRTNAVVMATSLSRLLRRWGNEGRPVDRFIGGWHEDCDMSAARCLTNPRVLTKDDRLRRGADRRWSTAFTNSASRVFTTRFEDERPSPARTSSTAGRVVTVLVRDLDVWSGRLNRRGGWLVYFVRLNFSGGLWSGIFESEVWPQDVYGLVYFNPDEKWSCEKRGC